MKVLLLAVVMGINVESGPGRTPASAVDHAVNGGCLIGLQGALGKYAGKTIDQDAVKKECSRLLSGRGPAKNSPDIDKYYYGCGVSVGAVISSVKGRVHAATMISDGSIEAVLIEICGKP